MPARFGKAKYGLERTIKVMLDLFTVKFLSSYANKPIYLFGGAGAILILISLAGAALPVHPPGVLCESIGADFAHSSR